MKTNRTSNGIDRRVLVSTLAALPVLSATLPSVSVLAQTATADDPLSSWNDGPAKQAILDFVRATTDSANPNFVPPEERIATFDQDDYGQITNNVRLQDATLQQYLIDYQNTVLKAQKEVEDGISSFVQSRAVVAFLRKSVDAAKGALKIATLEYQQGTRDFTAVLLAEQNLLQAENNLAVATGEVSLGLTAIFRALGGGWQIRNDSYFVWPATADEMRARTNWGGLLAPSGVPQPPAPGLPSPEDIGPTVRPPEW